MSASNYCALEGQSVPFGTGSCCFCQLQRLSEQTMAPKRANIAIATGPQHPVDSKKPS